MAEADQAAKGMDRHLELDLIVHFDHDGLTLTVEMGFRRGHV